VDDFEQHHDAPEGGERTATPHRPGSLGAGPASGSEGLDKGVTGPGCPGVTPGVIAGGIAAAGPQDCGAVQPCDVQGRRRGDSPSPSPARGPAGSARRIRAEMLEVLSVVRVARAEDLRRVLTPESRRTRYVNRGLRDLLAAGLVGRARVGREGFVWWLTRSGLAAVAASGDKPDLRPRESTGARVARSGVVDHALAVTELVTVMAAHKVGGVRDWQLERAHTFDGRTLITDLVLHVPHLDPSALLVEVDRDTMRSTAMGRKLALYAAYAAARKWEGARGTIGQTVPLWQRAYPGRRFPPLLVVVADVDERGLAARANLLHRVTRQAPRPSGGDLQVAVTSLDRLREEGPWAPVWTRVGFQDAGQVVGLGDLTRR
jgi:hypothetical protein